jgi:ppGpp synthetase/RelA/SpoT-type nucleotidyltranferase
LDVDEERKVRQLLDSGMHVARSLCNEIKAYVEQLCERLSREDFRFRLAESRTKEAPRIIKKLDRASAGADQLYDVVTDLIGLRVVVYNLSDVEVFKKTISEDTNCPLVELHFEDVKRKSGYRALHINGWAGSPQPMGCEIQVRTALQDAWAVTSRADLYDSEEDMDPLLTDLAEAQSEIVGAVDTVFQRIRDHRDRPRRRVDVKEITAADDQEAERPPGPSAPGLDHERIQAAIGTLEPSERYVLVHPISDQRVDELRSGIAELRRESSLRLVFDAAGVYQRLLEYRSDYRFGNRILAWKGPLVDGSNWASFSRRDFASASERFTHSQLCDRLRQESPPTGSLASWKDLPAFAGNAADKITAADGHPDLIVVAATPSPALYELVDWRLTGASSVRGTEVGHLPAVVGAVSSLPVFQLWAWQGSPCVYVVDLARTFRYTQTNPDAMSEDDLYLHVEPITFEKAVDLLKDRPDLLQSKEGERLTREEQVVRLQLQVLLSVIEGGRVETAEPGFAIGALIEVPVGGEL